MATLPLANGIIIDTKSGQAMPPKVEPVQDIPKEKKRIKEAVDRGRDISNKAVRISTADLPADPHNVTTVGVVWMYFTLGLNDSDIAACTGLRLDQIDLIKGTKLFTQIDRMLIDNINKMNATDIEGRIHALSSKAIDTVEGIIEDDEVEASVRLRAAQDLLDRAGHGSKQISEKRMMLDGGLLIKVVHENIATTNSMPEIVIDRKGAVDVS